MKLQRMLRHAVYLEGHRPQIANSYRTARRLGEDDLAVFVLDPSDPSARAILETSGEGEEVDAHLAEGRRRGVRTSITCGISRTLMVDLLAEPFPEIAASVAVPLDEGSFWVVVVTEGSASAVVLPPVAWT